MISIKANGFLKHADEFSLFLKIWFVLFPQPASEWMSQSAIMQNYNHIIAWKNWEIYRNSIIRVECTNVLEKFLSSNSVANQIKLCIESTFAFLKFAANRLQVGQSQP